MTVSCRFRHATEADLAAIVGLLFDDPLGREREIMSDPVHGDYRCAFAAILADPNQLQAVAEQDGIIVGCLQVSFIPGLSHRGAWRGQIEAVRVATHHQRTGIGRAFLVWAIDQCRERGCRMVQLTSSLSRTGSHAFYESLGFRNSHAGFKLDL